MAELSNKKQPLTLFRNRYHLIVSSVPKTLVMPNFPGNLVHAANPTSKGSRVECEKRPANDATVFRKAAWRKTRTRLQRMHNVSKRHIGEYKKKKEKKEKEWREKERHRLADCNGCAVAVGTEYETLHARERKISRIELVCVCGSKTLKERKRKERSMCVWGLWNAWKGERWRQYRGVGWDWWTWMVARSSEISRVNVCKLDINGRCIRDIAPHTKRNAFQRRTRCAVKLSRVLR